MFIGLLFVTLPIIISTSTPLRIMPNWCRNRVTVFGEPEEIAKVTKIFKDEKSIFDNIIKSPDWRRLPNMKGEYSRLEQHKNPKTGEVIFATYNFPDGKNDDRWYDWNTTNWGTKWDITVKSVEFAYEDSEQLEMEFETAWAPPEPICNRLREMFKDLHISWFYDEPGMETAGYL